MGSSFLTRDWTQAPALGVWSLSHWTTKEVPLACDYWQICSSCPSGPILILLHYLECPALLYLAPNHLLLTKSQLRYYLPQKVFPDTHTHTHTHTLSSGWMRLPSLRTPHTHVYYFTLAKFHDDLLSLSTILYHKCSEVLGYIFILMPSIPEECLYHIRHKYVFQWINKSLKWFIGDLCCHLILWSPALDIIKHQNKRCTI